MFPKQDEWHKWFAWYPVNVSVIGINMRWLVWVERRITADEYCFEYRDL